MDALKKLVVITGASSGIGAATASIFSKNGYPLLLLARRVDQMKQLNLPKSLCLPCDVTKIDQVKDCIESGVKKFGNVDCLVNNAGIMLQHMDPASQKIEEWNKMIEINCKGVLNGISCVLPQMKKSKTGTIINISSVAGKRTRVAASVYCGTKFFVHNMTENMREELAQDNVRMITIAPGAVRSEMNKHITDEKARERLKELFKLFTPLEPQKIAESIWWAYSMPQECCIRELVIAPTKQP